MLSRFKCCTFSFSTTVKNSISKGFFGSCCKCVKCLCGLSTGLELIKCPKCGTFQPAPPTRAETSCCPDFYRLLVLERKEKNGNEDCDWKRKFNLDLKALKSRYLKLQAAVHPDRLGSLGEAWSSWINRAHETLKNPLQRAIYLINYRDKMAIGSDEQIQNDLHDISLVLEIREELSMCRDPAELSRIKRENDERIRDCCGELERILDGDDGGGVNEAKKCINMLRYWMSIDGQIREQE
jgi:molecular chaperone HscB